jgi:hypothetical protein
MALQSANVRVAVTGALYVGPPTGVTAPADADAVLDTDLKDLGYVSEDGVTETRDRSTESIKAWQNSDEVRKTITEASLTYQLVLIETNVQTVELFYANTVDTSDGSIVVIPAGTGGRHTFVLDVIDGTSRIRTWIPQGEVTEIGDQVYSNGEPIGYEITLTAYPDATIGGSAVKWYSDLAA